MDNFFREAKDRLIISTTKSILAVCVIVAAILLTPMLLGKCKKTSKPSIGETDSLREYVRELNFQINTLRGQRHSLEIDTNRIYSHFNNLLTRIKSTITDTGQAEITKELLNNPNPQAIDVNQAIAQGQMCCALWQNNLQQLRLADSIIKIQDSIILIQGDQIIAIKDHVALLNSEIQDYKNVQQKKENRLRRWRTASVAQFSAIAAALTIYKLSH